ncbi:FecR domain-containing protein [Acidovorax sp. CCYZU-2555]|uniref:FecR family protein n=1 Tax=Acidovorax sp. CCYZU-2555 TaxID=2835042 RepID=UPI001BCF9DC2|nr:FecR domain-containing protein [Acidovorax sp. CCYZU-2555]MBS7777096.1 FecR domain-containing protein [Acidovorax sp. CCYZU-2555]
MLASGAAAHALTVQPLVAQATMVIGQVSVVHADGSASSMTRGFEVRVGDTVQTELGGHVHLRFVDGGRISVRPSSRLQIDSYGYSETDTQASAIKFKLEEGVVRSITGEWGAAARHRFRLNTPVAAIGVKGTDFLVKATSDLTSASVFTGAISVAPLLGACGAGLGPCQEGRLLSDDMKGQMVELGRLQNAPRLVPLADLAVASLPQQAVTLVERQPQNVGTAVLLAAADKPLLTEEQVAAAVNTLKPPTPPEPQQPTLPTLPVLPPEPPVVKTLSWGRYSLAQSLTGDSFSTQIDAAMLQASERLASNGVYALFRPLEDGKPVAYAPGSGTAQFRLAGAAASVVSAGKPVEHVSVTAATLGVNFDASTFATRLDVQGANMGSDVVQAVGTISKTGLMRSVGGSSIVQGGLSADGREAGYLFQKGISSGILQGITLWGR